MAEVVAACGQTTGPSPAVTRYKCSACVGTQMILLSWCNSPFSLEELWCPFAFWFTFCKANSLLLTDKLLGKKNWSNWWTDSRQTKGESILLRALSKRFLNTTQYGESTTVLGNQFQCSTTFTVHFFSNTYCKAPLAQLCSIPTSPGLGYQED